MSDTRLKQPSAVETRKKLVQTIERERVILLLTGTSGERIFEAAEWIRGQRDCAIGVDFNVPGIKDRLKALERKGGAGFGVFSISSAREARTAINAGAVFLFSTHLDKGIVRKCKSAGVLHAPGSLTPTEVYNSHDLRADAVSVFPCSVMRGADWILRLKEIFPGMKLIPTDRMTPEEGERYLNSGSYAVAPVIDTGGTDNPERAAAGFLKLRR